MQKDYLTTLNYLRKNRREESKEYFREMDRLYGGLDENGCHGLIYLNTRSPVGGTIWGQIRRCGLVRGSVSLEVCFEVSKAPPVSLSLYFLPPLFHLMDNM